MEWMATTSGFGGSDTCSLLRGCLRTLAFNGRATVCTVARAGSLGSLALQAPSPLLPHDVLSLVCPNSNRNHRNHGNRLTRVTGDVVLLQVSGGRGAPYGCRVWARGTYWWWEFDISCIPNVVELLLAHCSCRGSMLLFVWRRLDACEPKSPYRKSW